MPKMDQLIRHYKGHTEALLLKKLLNCHLTRQQVYALNKVRNREKYYESLKIPVMWLSIRLKMVLLFGMSTRTISSFVNIFWFH